MASIVKTPAGYRAFIMLKGVRRTKSFKSKYLAVNWARNEENLIRAAYEPVDESVYRPNEVFLYQGDELQAPNEQDSNVPILNQKEIEGLLEWAAEKGARRAIMTLVTYNLGDAAKQLGISPPTLAKRIKERKLKTVDGRITGAELMRYLKAEPT
jgi:hypothetical protein